MSWWSKSKKQEGGSSSYDVTEDPSMTRWRDRYCSNCGRTTSHKFFRHHQGSDRADVQCKGCGYSVEESW